MNRPKSIRKTGWLIILLVTSLLFIWTGCSKFIIQEKPVEPKETITPPVEEPPRVEEISIGAVGDVMVHSPQYKAANVGGEKGYDFNPVFEPIKKYIEEMDLAVANLETTLSGADKGYSGYPMFNSPEQIAEALKETGFDVITTANNHSLDRRSHGVQSTLDFLDEYNLEHTGTARSEEERDNILIKNIKDVSVAFLAYTYGTNGIPLPKDEPYLVNLIDKEQMELDISKAKESTVDLIIVSVHFGNEYQRKESEEQRELVDFLLEQGVDVVLGSHPHVIQPMEIRKVTTVDGEEKESFVIYSMGNFVSNQRDRYKDSGLILQLHFTKNFETNNTLLEKVEYIPTWVDKSNVGGKNQYHILAVEEAISLYENDQESLISQKDYEILQRTWKDTTEHLGQYDDAKMVLKPLGY